MRDLPKSTTHVVKKASDIFVPGDRGLHLYGTDKGLLSPSKVVTNPKNRGGHLVSDSIKKSPSTKQSLPAELALASSRRAASSSSEDENDRGFHVDDEESDEVSSSESTASEVEVGYEEEEDGTTSGRQEVSVDDEESVSRTGKLNGGMEESLVIEGDDEMPRAKQQRDGKQKGMIFHKNPNIGFLKSSLLSLNSLNSILSHANANHLLQHGIIHYE